MMFFEMRAIAPPAARVGGVWIDIACPTCEKQT